MFLIFPLLTFPRYTQVGVKINYFFCCHFFRQVQNRFYFSSMPNLLVACVGGCCFYVGTFSILNYSLRLSAFNNTLTCWSFSKIFIFVTFVG